MRPRIPARHSSEIVEGRATLACTMASLVRPEIWPARLVVREPRCDEHRGRLDHRDEREAGALREAPDLGMAVDRGYQRGDALRDDGAIVPVAYEGAPETGVVHDGEVRAELHAGPIADRLLDLTQSRLVAHDLARDVFQAQLV